MDDVVATPAARLYEEDFYAWTQAQAELLRDGRLAEADILNILEEIDSLGRTQVAELRSRFKVLAHHLLKEIYQRKRASRSWAVTILNQRQELVRHLSDNPSLKPRASEIFASAYSDARNLAATETGIGLETFPRDPPFTCAQAMDESFWPGRSIGDR